MFHRGRCGRGQDRGSGVRGGRAGLTGHAGKRWRRPAGGGGGRGRRHGLGGSADRPGTSCATASIERAIIGKAGDLLSGPGGLASFLRRRQLGVRVA